MTDLVDAQAVLKIVLKMERRTVISPPSVLLVDVNGSHGTEESTPHQRQTSGADSRIGPGCGNHGICVKILANCHPERNGVERRIYSAGSFAEFRLSEANVLRMTSEELSMTSEGLRMTTCGTAKSRHHKECEDGESADNPGQRKTDRRNYRRSILVRKYSRVFFNPSTRSTFAFQPRRVTARVTSGWRIFGSSSGSGGNVILPLLPVSCRISFANCSIGISSELPMLTGSFSADMSNR